MSKPSMDHIEFQRIASQVQIPDEAAGGVSHLVMQQRQASLVASKSNKDLNDKDIKFVYTSCGICLCVEGLRTCFSRIKLGQTFRRSSRSADALQMTIPNGNDSTHLEAWYKDLFTKHMVLREEHGKLKAEAEGWRTVAVEGQTLCQTEIQNSSMEDGVVLPLTATQFAITSATKHKQLLHTVSTSSSSRSRGQSLEAIPPMPLVVTAHQEDIGINEGSLAPARNFGMVSAAVSSRQFPSPQCVKPSELRSGSDMHEGCQASQEQCNSQARACSERELLVRECSDWFEPVAPDIGMSTSDDIFRASLEAIKDCKDCDSPEVHQAEHSMQRTERVDDDVVSKAFAVVDSLKIADAQELADMNQNCKLISDSESFSSVSSEGPHHAIWPEDTIEFEEASTCVGSELPVIQVATLGSLAQPKSSYDEEVPADIGEIMRSIQTQVRGIKAKSVIDDEENVRVKLAALQNLPTTPEEEVGLDGCESARPDPDRTNSRPFAAIEVHPNVTKRVQPVESSYGSERDTSEIGSVTWWKCGDYRCRIAPSCQESN